MRRLSLVLIALLLLPPSGVPATWAAGPAGSARDRVAAERTSPGFKALLGQLSGVLSKIFAAEGPYIDPWGRPTVDEGPAIDPLGRATSDEGPHIDPLGRATGDTGPVIDPWGGATSDNGPKVDPWG